MIHEMDEFDLEIQRLEPLIDRAADSLLTFYADSQAGFLRSTLPGADTASATSSARSVFALAEYVRFLQERAASADRARLTHMTEILDASFTAWIAGLTNPDGWQRIRQTSDNRENYFTDSHLLLALSMTLRLTSANDLRCDARLIHHAGWRLQTNLMGHLEEHGGAKIHDGDPTTHDFITLHALRAIDSFAAVDGHWQDTLAARKHKLVDNLGCRAERDVLARLGYHSARVEAEFDPAELLFTAALLERCKTPNWEKLLYRAVQVVVEDQTEDGAWVGSRVVAYEKRGLLHVASYEVGLTLTFLASSAIRRDDQELLERTLPALRRVCDLARTSFQSGPRFKGWANDRTRWPSLLEGWATAIVLTLLMRYREVLLDCRQCRLLANYRCELPEPADGSPVWPDLQRTLRVPEPSAGPILTDVSDPSPNGELVQALGEKILDPILQDPAERPLNAGLILYGVPGTRKTTMVKQIAKELHWPMITLSPPDFLSNGGLDGFEAAADRVFNDLKRLMRVVILFDECEDFFRPRATTKRKQATASRSGQRTASSAPSDTHNNSSDPPRPGPQQSSVPDTRTLGAFITAGMLPRLQDLRDARWNLFVLATNVQLEELDSAAIRPGRFDFAQDIPDPCVTAQVRYAERHRKPLSDEARSVLIAAIKAVNAETNMPFRAIDAAAETLHHGKPPFDAREIERVLEFESSRSTPLPLYLVKGGNEP